MNINYYEKIKKLLFYLLQKKKFAHYSPQTRRPICGTRRANLTRTLQTITRDGPKQVELTCFAIPNYAHTLKFIYHLSSYQNLLKIKKKYKALKNHIKLYNKNYTSEKIIKLHLL